MPTFTRKIVKFDENETPYVCEISNTIQILPKKSAVGVMIVGIGGNNGSTLVAGLLANKLSLTWENKTGKNVTEFLGSLSQVGTVHLGYTDKNKPVSKPFREMLPMADVNDFVLGGWDISKDNLDDACRKNKVIDYDLRRQLEPVLKTFVPSKSVYYSDFIASNQKQRANNILDPTSKLKNLEQIKSDIQEFKKKNNLEKVVVVWTASTERFSEVNWETEEEIKAAIENNHPEISPSMIFAMASLTSGCIFLNGSPQNTICKGILSVAKNNNTFVGGEDFKTGQTKLKSVLADYLVSSGLRPLSIVSYNHLGNNDGMNLDEKKQFRSKEITKKNVIDDIIEENSVIFENKRPDHCVVIKYIPAVGDSKRAMDEYNSELFLGGRNTLAIHNTCEDSLLAVPVIIDLIIFSELFSRARIDNKPFSSSLSLLSFFFKAPATNTTEPVINSFFRQRNALENFFRICNDLPLLDFLNLERRV